MFVLLDRCTITILLDNCIKYLQFYGIFLDPFGYLMRTINK